MSDHGPWLDHLIGWHGAAAPTRAQLLRSLCSGIRLRSLMANTLALVLMVSPIIAETQRPSHALWLALVVAAGFLPRLYARRVLRHGLWQEKPERSALVFLTINAGYGVLWGLGPLILLPAVPGWGAAVLLIVVIFGTVMGPYAAMPGLLYVRFATTAAGTLAALALHMDARIALLGAVSAVWLALRTDAWRGYHRALRQQIELASALADRQASLERANRAQERANRELQAMAETDPLTGVGNRRRLLQQLEHTTGPAALILFDIDHFKAVNDAHGHAVGDALLIDVSRIARQALRADDTIARLGGDEFAVLLPGVTEADALTTADRMRGSVETHAVTVGERALGVTISLGVAMIPPDASLAEPGWLFREADAMLYEAKREGRNRMALAPAEGTALNAG